jgi:mediator of RNA polymerase II transcription subunit 21
MNIFPVRLIYVLQLTGNHSTQTSSLRRLEAENQDAAAKLEEVVKRGERLLDRIQDALHDIAQSQLAQQNLSNSGNS